MSAKIITYGSGITAGSTAIPDNTSVALDIESTDAKDYITVDTTDGSENIGLGVRTVITADTSGTPDDLGDYDNYALVLQGSSGHVGGEEDETGLLLSSSNNAYGGSAIVHKDTGAGGKGELSLYTKQATGAVPPVKVMTLTDAGSVGIQSAAPAHLLHVQDGDLGIVTNSADTAANSLVFTKSRNATDGSATIVNNNDVLGRIDWYAADASSGTTADNQTISASIYSQIDGTPGDGAMPGSIRFATTPDGASSLTDRFVIRQNGNIGIGDTEPNYTAVIGGSKSGPIIYNYNSNTSGISSAITAAPNGAAGMIIDHRVTDSLYVMNTTSTNAANSRSTGIAFFGRVDGGSDGDPNAGAADSYPMMGALRVKHEGSAEDQKGYMAFYTNDGTDDRVPTERMRITSEGDVKFGSANYYPLIQSSGGGTSAGNVSYSFVNDTDTGFTSGGSSNTCGIATLGTYRMFFAADGKVGVGLTNPAHVLDVVGTAGLSTGTAWTDTSDSRIKTDVQNIENALDKINQLRPVSFNYTEDYLNIHPEIDGSKRYNSFVAQEYAEVFPDAVKSTAKLERIVTPESEGVEEVRETLVEDLHQYTPHDLHMYLVKAVQELSAKVTALEEAQGN